MAIGDIQEIDSPRRRIIVLAWWVRQDRKKPLRIIKLIQEAQRDPFGGIGKPEILKTRTGRLLVAGCWLLVAGPSVSMKKTDRFFEVKDDKIRILACRYHYSRNWFLNPARGMQL